MKVHTYTQNCHASLVLVRNRECIYARNRCKCSGGGKGDAVHGDDENVRTNTGGGTEQGKRRNAKKKMMRESKQYRCIRKKKYEDPNYKQKTLSKSKTKHGAQRGSEDQKQAAAARRNLKRPNKYKPCAWALLTPATTNSTTSDSASFSQHPHTQHPPLSPCHHPAPSPSPRPPTAHPCAK